MDRKNRVKMLINKLWKTREIQAPFEIQVFRPGWFDKLRGQDRNRHRVLGFENSQPGVDKRKSLLKTSKNTSGLC
jgi:hypothetical protein